MILFIRVMFMRGSYKKDDDDEEMEDDSDEEEDEKDKKKKTYTAQDFMKDEGKKRILILYATQTGTAQEFAETFEEECEKYGFVGYASSIHNFQQFWQGHLVDGKIDVLCYILATYGEGEPTDSAKPFFSYLSKGCEDELSKLNYVSFGLGNSQYSVRNYQAFSRANVKMMNRRGAVLLGEPGEGDSDQFIEDDFDDWRRETLEFLSDHFGTILRKDLLEVNLDYIEPKYLLKFTTDREEAGTLPKKVPPPPFTIPRVAPSQKHPYPCALVEKTELLEGHSADNYSSTMELMIDISESRIRYDPGDHLGVWAPNDPLLVMELSRRLGVLGDLERGLSLIRKSNPILGNRYFSKTSLLNVFSYYLDLTYPPTRKQLSLVYRYTTDEKERELIFDMVNDDSSVREKSRALYRKNVVENEMTWLEVLVHLIPSCMPPLEVFLEACSLQQPRYYSIASCSDVHKESGLMRLVVAIHRFEKTTLGVKQKLTGVSSRFLETVPLYGGMSEEEFGKRKEENSKGRGTMVRRRRALMKKFNPNLILCFVRESLFRLPPAIEIKLGVPIVFVCNGTGIAPFLGMLESLEHRGFKGSENQAQVMLFYGCRHREGDFLYSRKIMKWKEEGCIKNLGLAFSRDQEEKVYVQHVLEKEKKEVVKAIMRGAYLYVCGSSAMANDVSNKLIEALKSEVPRLKDVSLEHEVLERLRIEAWNL